MGRGGDEGPDPPGLVGVGLHPTQEEAIKSANRNRFVFVRDHLAVGWKVVWRIGKRGYRQMEGSWQRVSVVLKVWPQPI